MSLRNAHAATLVLAEDDVTYGKALSDLLRMEGYTVHHALDGVAALDTVRDLGEGVDLLLCDLLLPKKSGFEVIREVVDLQLSCVILAMTGVYQNFSEIHALRELGVKGYVHKSTPFEHVLFRINNSLFPSDDEQRQDYRVAASIPVQFCLGDRTCYGTSFNLSVTGAYVRTHEPVLAGATVDLALGLPTARDMVQLTAEVVHSTTPADVRGTAYPAGFGVRFRSVNPLGLAAIRRFVETVHAEETGQRPVVPALGSQPIVATVTEEDEANEPEPVGS